MSFSYWTHYAHVLQRVALFLVQSASDYKLGLLQSSNGGENSSSINGATRAHLPSSEYRSSPPLSDHLAFRPRSVPLPLWSGCPPYSSFLQTQLSERCTLSLSMPNLPTTLRSHAMNTSQTMRSTMQPTTPSRAWRPCHSPVHLSSVYAFASTSCASTSCRVLDLQDAPCYLRNFVQGLQISSITRRMLVDIIRLRRRLLLDTLSSFCQRSRITNPPQ